MKITGPMKIILSSLIMGSMGVLIRWIDLPSPVITFYRVFFASITLFTILKIKKQKINLDRLNRKLLLISAIGFTASVIMLFYAFSLTSISNANLTFFTFPIFIAVLSPIFLKEKLEKATLLALLISFVGVAMIFSPQKISFQNMEIIGLILSLMGGLLASFVIMILKKISEKYSGLVMSFVINSISVLLTLPFIFIFNHTLTITRLVLLLILGIFPGTISKIMFYSGLRDVKVQHAGILSYFEPFSAIIFSMLFLSELPTIFTVLGGLLIFIGGVLVVRKR